MNNPKVFIGSASESLEIARAIQNKLSNDAEITLWEDAFDIGTFPLDTLLNIVDDFDFAVFTFSDDDVVNSRGVGFEAPRDNVIFELGLFMSKLGKERTYIVNSKKGIKIPSDLNGLTYTLINHSGNDSISSIKNAVAVPCNQIRDRIKALGLRKHKSHNKILYPNSVVVNRDIDGTLHPIFHKLAISQLDNDLKSGFSIKECIDSATISLSFMGIGATKWVEEREAFQHLIKRLLLKTNHQVRFLILNPNSENARKLSESQGKSHEKFVENINQNIKSLQELSSRGLNLSVKTYDYSPIWRITIIDDNKVVFGTYLPTSNDGMESPQMIFNGRQEWAFTHNIISYFENMWKDSQETIAK